MDRGKTPDPYRGLFETMLDAAVVLDATTARIALANMAAARIFGFGSPQEMVGENPLDYVPKEDQERVALMMAASFERDSGNPTEIRIMSKDKRMLWVSARVTLIEHEGKKAVLATIRDITSDKAKDAALRTAEESKMRLIDATAQSIFIIQDGKFVYVNPAGAKAAGLSQEQMIGKSFMDFIHPEERERITERYQTLGDGHSISGPSTVKGIDASGQMRWTEAQDIPFSWEGKPAIMTLVADITDKMRLEEERKEREERLRAIIENAWDGITILDENDHIIFESPSVARMAGYTPEELMGADVLQTAIHPDDLAPLAAKLETLKSEPGSTIRDVKIRYRHKDGSWRWLEAAGRNLLHDAKVRGLVINFRDITEKVKAEQALKEQEERLRTVVENAWDGVVIFDENYNVLFESPALSRMTGYSPQEWKGKSPAEWPVHPDDVAPVLASLDELKSRHGSTVSGTMMRLRHKDGSWRTIEASGRSLLQDPRVKGIVINFRDITENVEAHEAVIASEERFRTLIEKATDVVIVLDPTGKITYQSPSLERVTGFGPNEWVDRSLAELLIHPDDMALLASLLERILGKPGETVEGVTVRYQHKDGSWHVLEAAVTNMLHDPKVGGIVANFRDITDRKAAQAALAESEKKFRALAEGSLQGIMLTQGSPPRAVYCNSAMANMTGYTVDEMMSMTPQQMAGLIHPDEREMFFRRYADRAQGLPVDSRYEFRAVRKDGSIRWFEIFATLTEYQGEPAVQGAFADVTDRKAIQQALAESEQKYRLLVENSNDLIFSLDAQGNFTYVSPAIERISGYRIDEVIGTSFIRFVFSEDLPGLTASFERTLSGASEPAEFRSVMKDGTVRWVRTASRLTRRDGQVVGLTGIMSDITARKQAEEALRRSESLLRDTQELARVGGWEYDVKRDEAVWTDETYRIHEIPKIPTINHVAESLKCYPPEGRQKIAEAFQKCLEEGIPYDLELPFVTFKGNRRWVRTTAKAVREGDRIARVLGNVIDITDRRRIEDALRSSEQRNRTIVDNANEAVVVIQEDVIKFANRRLEEITGFSAQELHLKPYLELVHPDHWQSQTEILIGKPQDADVPSKHEFMFVDKTGNAGWAEMSATSFEWEGSAATLALIYDITARKHAEEALQASEERSRTIVENANEAIGVLQDGVIKMANPKFASATGYSIEELLFKPFLELIHPDDQATAAENYARRQRGEAVPSTYQFRFVDKAGNTRWAELNATLFEWGGQTSTLALMSDITERKRAEEALRDSEAIYKRLFENTQTAMEVISGETGLVVLANESTARMFGFDSAADLVGLDSMQYLLPEDRERVISQIAQALVDRSWSKGTELTVCTKDGRRLWINGMVTTTEYKGKPALLISLVDLTARKQAEDTLRESEEKYRLLTEKTNDLIYLTDFNLTDTYVSPSVERILGFTPEEHMARSADQQMTPESLARAQAALSEHLAQEKDPKADPNRMVSIELEYYRKDGTTVWLEEHVSFVRDASGNAAGIHGVARDVSERRRAEQAMRASEEKYRLVAESTNDEIWTSDINLNTTYVSPSVEKLLGFTVEERMKQDIMAQMTPESFARAAEALQRHLALEHDPTADPNRVLRIELEYYRKDRSTVWLENQVSGIRDANGTLIGFHGVARDVTERRRMEQALRESEEKYRLLAEKTNDVIWTSDLSLRSTYVSPSIERILGFSPEERLKQEASDQMTPESFGRAAEALSEQLALEEDPSADPNRALRIELEYYRKDGSTVWLENQVSGLRDAGGKLTGFHGVARDISERRKAEQALKENEERYRLLAENASDIIWVTNADLKVIYASPSTTSLLGYSIEELSVHSFDTLLAPDSMTRVAGVYKDALALEKTTPGSMKNVTMQMEVRTKSGSTVWLEAAINVIRDRDGRFAGFQGACRNISERRRAEEALKASEERFRTLIEESTDAIAILDASGHLLYETPSMERVTGYALDDWQDTPVGDWLLHPDDLPKMGLLLERLLTHPEVKSEEVSVRFKHKDGTWHFLEGTVRNLLGDPKVKGLVINYRDVTERMKTQQALSKKTEELDGFFSVALDLLCIADANGRFHLLNRAWETALGYTRQELMAGKFFDFIHPDDVKSTEEAVAQLASGQEVINFINRYRCRDGSYRWLEWRSAPSGNMIYAAARDITEQRIIQQELAVSEIKYRSVFDHTLLGTEVIDAETMKVVLANRSIAKMFGFKSPEDMVGTSPIDYVLPGDMEWVADQMAKVLANPEMRDVVNIRARTEDGRVIWVTGSATSFEHEGKWSMLLSLIDITAAKEAELKLHEEEEKNRLLIENAAEGIAVIQDGLVKFVNPKCTEFAGRTAEEMISMPFLEMIHPEDRQLLAENYARRVVGGEAVNNYQFRIVDKQGNTKWLQINAGQLDWEGKPATLAMLNDITERVKAAEALAASEAKYRDLFEHTLLGMEVVDGQTGQTVLANRSIAKMFGFKSVQDMIGTRPLDYVLPEDLDWVSRQIAELMVDSSWDRKAVIRTRTEDGRLIWVTGMTTPFEYEGKPAMLISLVDITAAKESELKLQESEEKNRVLIDNAAEAIVVLQDGLVKFVNPKGAELVGRVRDQATPIPFADFVHPDDRQMIMENHAKRLAGEEAPNNYNFRMIDKYGNSKWIQINAVRFEWEGKPAVLAMLNDITERVTAQEALAISEANYRNLFDHTLIGMEVVDAETMKVVLANHSIAKMFGFKSPEDMVGTEPLHYVLPEDLDYVVDELRKTLTDPTIRETATLRARTEDGRTIWVTGITTTFEYVRRPSILVSVADVTAAKEAELRLQESEEKNRLLIDNAAEAIAVIQDGATKFCNRRLAELTGWSVEQLLQRSFLDLVHPEEREQIALNYMMRIGGQEVPNNYQFRIIDKTGKTKWLQVSAVRFNWEGKPASLTMFSDVTERVKAEQAVRDSEERFRALIEKATDAIAIVDAQGKIIYYSPSIERATGYESKEWVSRSLADWRIHADDLASLAPVFEDIVKEPGRIIEGLKVRYEHIDGTLHTLEATVRNLLHDPKINGLVANFRDVTERVKAEELLRNSEERFRGLVETTSDWVWEVDRNSRYTYVSPKAHDILGYEPQELLGHTPFEFMHQKEGRRVSKIMRRFAAARLPFSLMENTCTHKDGHSVVLETSAVPILDAGGDFLGYRGIDRDITERKKVEQELQRSLKRLEKTMESTIEAITTTIETRDPYTTGHQMRVTDLACSIARVMELTPDQIEGIRVAGLLHDIGKIAIPTEILSKPGKLNEVEYEMIKTHAKVGYNILKKIEFPWPVARAVLQHHEKWNGSGYPHGLRGEDILLEARILAVADVMEAMSSHRPYRPSIGADKALEEITKNSGILYDPAVVRACLTAFTQGGFRFAPSLPAVESGGAPSDEPARPL